VSSVRYKVGSYISETTFFIATAVKTSNLKQLYFTLLLEIKILEEQFRVIVPQLPLVNRLLIP
jgi:hypothetical protein